MKAWVVRTGFAVFVIGAALVTPGEEGQGTLRVEIRDQATGRITPAMVGISSAADGLWRTPPDGRVAPPYTEVKECYQPLPWKPGDIGPVRLTRSELKVRGDTRPASFPIYPFWGEPAAYFVSQPFTITLPAGRWRLAVARGPEYLPVFEDFEIAPGERKVRKVELRRWVNMPRLGWYSGDDHVHYPRLSEVDDQLLITWAQAEDLHVTNVLRMGDIEKVYFGQARFGREARHQREDYVLASGQEDPRTDIGEQGHTIALDIAAPVRDTSRYHLYDLMFDGVRAQGGLTGYAHIAWASDSFRERGLNRHATWDATINVPRGKVDFFEILQFRKLGLEELYDFLNLGYRITAAAGSDFPWANTIGEARMYAYTGPRFSADAWFAAVKRGRTFITNGPMLTLTVDQAIPGDELQVRPGAEIRILAKAWAPAAIGAPRQLEIVAHGNVIGQAEPATPGQPELCLDLKLRPKEGVWIAARTRSDNGAVAHTSPVYVRTGTGGFGYRSAIPGLVAKRLAILEFIEGRLGDARFTRTYQAGEVDALRSRIQEARERYRELLR
jgi:hypothetical protein